MYAIVEIGGKQYRVSEGESVTTDKIAGSVGDFVSIDHVLLLKDKADKLHIGTPFVEGLFVNGQIVGAGKGEKVHVSKFKAKVRYRRTIGFRAELTQLKILSIGGENTGKTEAKKSKKEKTVVIAKKKQLTSVKK